MARLLKRAFVEHVKQWGTSSLQIDALLHQLQQVAWGARAATSQAAPPRVGRLNHIAIAVPDVSAAAARYREVLGATVSAPQALPEHGVRVCFVQLENAKLELLEPLGDASPIAKFLEKNPAGGMHHLCLEVSEIQAAVDHISQSPARLLNPKPKIGAHGTPVVFLHPKDMCGVLTELEEVQQTK